MASPASAQPISMVGSASDPNQQYHPMLEFQAGVTACLVSWSALRTAVESGWGGGERESQKKAEDLRCHIFSKFDGRFPLANYEAFDLADDLAIYIEEEFSVTLQDDSERQLAETIFRLYEYCLKGDPSSARQMVAQAAGAVALSSQFPVRVQTTEHDDDDEEMESNESSTAAGTLAHTGTMQTPTQQLIQNPMIPPNLADYIDQPMFGKAKKKEINSVGPIRQLGEKDSESVVEMDEDGFAPVKKGNRRR
mmetsp:Transcript_27551/g.75192  ORF Transcript_27551/g.75192 Transcript_27551/m.75192 type:complete len:251 (-) Transcript_27551:2415-3167(-)